MNRILVHLIVAFLPSFANLVLALEKEFSSVEELNSEDERSFVVVCGKRGRRTFEVNWQCTVEVSLWILKEYIALLIACQIFYLQFIYSRSFFLNPVSKSLSDVGL